MTPLRCEPPAEHRGHRWHWLRWMSEKPQIAAWSGFKWNVIFETANFTPEQAAAYGYTYHAPAIPPGTAIAMEPKA